VRCVLGEPPRLLGPLTTSVYHDIPAGGTVVGIRLRPGVLGGLVAMPADELVDQDVAGADIWGDVVRLTDILGEAATPQAAAGVGPKELHRILRFQGFIARVQASVDQQDVPEVDLARWAVEAGYHDQAHLSRECRRPAGSPPGELLAQYGAACACGHDHAVSYLPMLAGGDGRFVQEGRSVPA
jgi:hypothetical protein